MVLTKGVQTYKQLKVKVRQIVITNGCICDVITFARWFVLNTKHNVKSIKCQISTYIKC
jgi:predicted GNAT superfamily acetyltransferase